ncbi:MAG: hypothetical protein NVSMB12_10770 [Acidimicrobiales bacterium]
MILGTGVVLASAVVATLLGFGYAEFRLGQIHRVSIASLRGTGAGGAETVLVVGSDSRAANRGADATHFGSAKEVVGQRSDTIILVRLDAHARTASLMSVPRDLWVTIPGTHAKQRINTTFDKSPDLLVRAVQDSLGIPVDHFAEVDFQSFRQVVDAVGGVKVYFPTPARDSYSGLNITTPGCYGLSGDMALSFVRARHYQYEVGHRWVAEPESDLARIRRQQLFVRKVLSTARSTGPLDLSRINRIVGGVAKNLTVDTRLSQTHMLGLARTFRGLTPDQMPSITLPTSPAVISGNDVLVLKEPDARTAIDAFLNPPPPAPAPTGTAGGAAPAAPAPAPPYALPGLTGPLPPC